MTRMPRHDEPNRLHHIVNRASRRQVLFADRRDYRRFLAILACAVRRGELEIAAFCLMGTHFHLLARSPTGDISYAMMRVQNAYARYRNRRGRQDGSLFRGRFRSKPVTSIRYFLTLVRYIDHNPVQAGLCRHPFEYPYGSARHYASRRTPRWLSRSIVYEQATGAPDPITASDYALRFGQQITDDEIELIERRFAQPNAAEDDLDALFAAPPRYLAQWMEHKTRAAGGRSPWIPVASRQAVIRAVEGLRERIGEWRLSSRRKRWDGWEIAGAGLLKTLACLSVDEIGDALDCHRATAASWVRRHTVLLLSDSAYCERMGTLARAALDATFAE